MMKHLTLIAALACLPAFLAHTALAGCGGGGGEGRSNSTPSEASTPPTGYTPGVGGTATSSGWTNVTISWDHDHVSAEAAATREQEAIREAQRQEMEDRLDQQALDFLYDDSQDPPSQAEIDRQRAERIREQLGNPDEGTMAAIRHDFPTMDAQEALIGILTERNRLEQQRHTLPPETYNAIRQELTAHYQALQNAAASDRFDRALNFGLSVTVNAGSAALGGTPGFALGFTYNLISGGGRNAATGSVVSAGSTAVQSLVPAYALVAPVADAYAQDRLNQTLEGNKP